MSGNALLDQLLRGVQDPPPVQSSQSDRDSLTDSGSNVLSQSPRRANKTASAADLLATLIGGGSGSRPQSVAEPDRGLTRSIPDTTSYSRDSNQLLASLVQQTQQHRIVADTAAQVPLPLSPAPAVASRGSTPVAARPFFAQANPFDDLDAAIQRNRSATAPIAGALDNIGDRPTSSSLFLPAEKAHVDDGSLVIKESSPALPVLQENTHSTASTSMGHRALLYVTAPGVATAKLPPMSHMSFTLPSNFGSASRLDPEHVQKVHAVELPHDMLDRSMSATTPRYIVWPAHLAGGGAAFVLRDKLAPRSHGSDNSQTMHATGLQPRIINLSFASPNSGDEDNVLMATDAENNVTFWHITAHDKVDKVLEVAGPSDINHKTRGKWSPDGSNFALSITSRIYVFGTDDIVEAAGDVVKRSKLHSEHRHPQCLCICKAEKAVKDFAFSPDAQVLVSVDKAGAIRLWQLDHSDELLLPTATLQLTDKALLSVEFVGARHIVCGGQYNEYVQLVDLEAGQVAQELHMPVFTGNRTTTSRLHADLDLTTLFINDEGSNAIFAFVLDLPDTDNRTLQHVQGLLDSGRQGSTSGTFGAVALLRSTSDETRPESKLLSFTTSLDGGALEVVVVSSNAISSFCMVAASLHELNQKAPLLSALDLSAKQINAKADVPAAQSAPVLPNASTQSVAEPEAPKSNNIPRAGKGELPAEMTTQQPTPARTPSNKRDRRIESSGPPASSPYTTEPRTAEIAARIEANIKSTLTAELQKNASQAKEFVESLQAKSDTRHESILKLVSSTLSTNTTKVLKSAVHDSIEQHVLPQVSEHIDKSVQSQLARTLPNSLKQTLTAQLPDAISGAVIKGLSSSTIPEQIEATVRRVVKEENAVTVRSTEDKMAEALVRLGEQIAQRQQADAAKIAALTSTVAELRSVLEGVVGEVSSLRATLATSQRAQAQPVESASPAFMRSLAHPAPAQPLYPSSLSAQPSYLESPSASASASQSAGYRTVSNGPGVDLARYRELIVDFVVKSQSGSRDADASRFVHSFLSWQPTEDLRQDILASMRGDQISLFSFVHALASALQDEHGPVRLDWIVAAVGELKAQSDPRVPAVQVLSLVERALGNYAVSSQASQIGTRAFAQHAYRLVDSKLHQLQRG